MKLSIINFYLDWPRSLEVIKLRKLIVKNLIQKGRVIRWSIVDIQDSVDSLNAKKLRINAVLISSSKS